ncbi:MAG: galactokinase [Rhodothermales bacterium]|jgi:galactokinase
MGSRLLRSGRGAAPKFVKPLLNTLNEMRVQDRPRPEQLNALAEAQLWETFGAQGDLPQTAFAHSSLDLMAEHTHYFDGFALFMPLMEGCAVSMRTGKDQHRIVVGMAGQTAPDTGQNPALSALKEQVKVSIEALFAGREEVVDVSLVTNIPEYIYSGAMGAAIVATARATSAHQARHTTEEEDLGVAYNGKGPDRHYISSRVSASTVQPATAFVLVDPRSGESLSMELPPKERPGLALVAPSGTAPGISRGENRKMMRGCMAQLRGHGFATLNSVRDIEHRDLERASNAVDRKFRPLLNYLVTENGRVQKLVAAIQHRDWQMFGALLLMSHASKAADIGLQDDTSDAIVAQIENMSLDGMYGATRLNADNRAVLIAGQQFSVPPALEQLRASFEERTHESLSTLLL